MYAAGIVEMIITLPIGILFITVGVLLWKKQKIRLIHDYHCKNVKTEDVKAYTTLWGIGMVILGVCICLVGIVDLILHTEFGWILFGVGFAACFLIGNRAQKKYNGSWFSD